MNSQPVRRKSLTQNKEHEAVLETVLQDPSNRLCADCFRPSPRFVDVDHFVIVCTLCSSIHRSLLFHMKSFNPIFGFTSQELEGLRNGGNMLSNRKYLAKLYHDEINQLSILQCNQQQLREHIHHKYIDKFWFSPEPINEGKNSNPPVAPAASPARQRSRSSDATPTTQAVGYLGLNHSPQSPPQTQSPQPPQASTADSNVVYAFAVGKDTTARRAVRVSERFVKKNRIPSTSAFVAANLSEEASYVGMLEVVSPQSTTDESVIMGSEEPLIELLHLDDNPPTATITASAIAPSATSRLSNTSTYSLAS